MPSDLPSRTFTVRIVSPTDVGAEDFEVTAAYCQEERSFLTFKDSSHAVVAAYKSDYVVRVVRGPLDNAV